MAYTTKLIITDQNKLESDITTYLTSESPTTIHTISCFTRGIYVYVVIVSE